MKKSITIKKFTYLFLAKMAERTKVIQLDPNKKGILECTLPVCYKKNIQNIMCEPNGWAEEFSNLIDVEVYFKDHFNWEMLLSTKIKEVLTELKKDFEYDFVNDKIRINFTQKEVDAILSKFTKKEKENMDHFVNLVNDYIYTREFMEEYYDEDAKSTSFMHELHEKKYRDPETFKKFIEGKKQKAYGVTKEELDK